MPKTDPITVQFDLSTEATRKGKFVIRKAPVIFKSGPYPDKQFSITPEELDAAAKAYDPSDIDLEHMPTVLSGKLGKFVAAGTAPDQSEPERRVMFGAAVIPEWLDRELKPEERKLSATWDRKTKRLKNVSLVRNPRIEDAHLLASFSSASDEEKQAVTFEMGDLGMTPPESTQTPEQILAAITDLAKGGLNVNPEIYSKSYLSKLQKIIDLAGAGTEEEPETKEEVPMSQTKTETTPDLAQFKVEFDAMSAKLKAAEAAVETERAKRIDSEAAAFAKSLIEVENKAYPAERDHIIKAYKRAASTDVVTFSSTGKDGDALAELKAMFAARPAHKLTREVVPNFRTLNSENGGGGESETDKDRKQAKEFAAKRNAIAGNGKA